MEILYWLIILFLLFLAFLGFIFPLLPGALFLVAAFLCYGLFFTFEPLNASFWLVVAFSVLLLFLADYLANALGVKKFGGSKAAILGSTAGLLLGPFIIPFAGIVIGPFLGAVIAEVAISKKPWEEALKVGAGSAVSLIGSVLFKSLVLLALIVYFLAIVL